METLLECQGETSYIYMTQTFSKQKWLPYQNYCSFGVHLVYSLFVSLKFYNTSLHSNWPQTSYRKALYTHTPIYLPASQVLILWGALHWCSSCLFISWFIVKAPREPLFICRNWAASQKLKRGLHKNLVLFKILSCPSIILVSYWIRIISSSQANES